MVRIHARVLGPLAAALLALACQKSGPAAAAADDGMVWTDGLARIELEHLESLSEDDAAIAVRFYERARADNGFEAQARARRSLSQRALGVATGATSSEELFALAYPVTPARKSVLFALAQDPNLSVAETARQAQILNGLASRLPAADARDSGSFAGAAKVWKSFREFPNPGAADAFFAFAHSNAHPFFRNQSVFALAAANDLRAVPLLAEILGHTPPGTLLARPADKDREEACDAVETLALGHPEAHDQLLAALEGPLFQWHAATGTRYPGLPLAAAALGSRTLLPELGALAFPKEPLPEADSKGRASATFQLANYAMRYVALLRDDASFPELIRQLERRPPELDLSKLTPADMDMAMLAQTLTVLAGGAAEALGVWGDQRAVAPLLAHARDGRNTETSRVRALRAVVQLTPASELPALLETTLKQLGQTGTEGELAFGMLQGFELRPLKSPRLWTALEPGVPAGARVSAAHILGLAGLTSDEQAKLLSELKSADVKRDRLGTTLRAWIVMMGGDADAARAALRSLPGPYKHGSDIAGFWALTLPSIGKDELESGRLFRIVRNGVALSRAARASGGDPWPTVQLAGKFELARFGRDARELPRAALLPPIMELGRHGSPEQAEAAAWTLALMYERDRLLPLLQPNPGATPAEAQRRAAVRDALRYLDNEIARTPLPGGSR